MINSLISGIRYQVSGQKRKAESRKQKGTRLQVTSIKIGDVRLFSPQRGGILMARGERSETPGWYMRGNVARSNMVFHGLCGIPCENGTH